MRIAIYNRWAQIGGGGERHAFALAQSLARNHTVTLLTLRPLDAKALGTQLGLDLGAVSLKVLPDSADARLISARSADYDLFVNASHGELIQPHARRNALLTFFPQALPPRPPAPPPAIQLAGGFYAAEGSPAAPFRWSDGQGRLRLAPLAHGARLRLTLRGAQPPGWPPLAVVLHDAQGRPIDRRLLPPEKPQDWIVPLPAALHAQGGELLIETSYFVPSQIGLGDDDRMLGVQLLAAEVVEPGWWRGRVLAGGDAASLTLHDRAWQALAAYQLVLANSRYTQEWIARRWGRQSQLLYPPVAVERRSPGPKHRQILGVGRFFTGLHHKGQLELVRAFARLCDQGLRDWNLVLAGRVDSSQPAHLAYVQQVRDAARGYPVEVVTDVDQARLDTLYAESALYWHAAGLGADAEREPERCEHFGISVVEAMAAGCVPLVFACGGPAEIVEPAASGLTWRDADELCRQTAELAADEPRRQTIAAAARLRSRAFGWESFERQVAAVLAHPSLQFV
jgi:glycosyltransferase involved in cell wall biosynthesis